MKNAMLAAMLVIGLSAGVATAQYSTNGPTHVIPQPYRVAPGFQTVRNSYTAPSNYQRTTSHVVPANYSYPAQNYSSAQNYVTPVNSYYAPQTYAQPYSATVRTQPVVVRDAGACGCGPAPGVGIPMTAARPVALKPGSYIGRGIIGQQKVYRAGQPVRNFFRFITP